MPEKDKSNSDPETDPSTSVPEGITGRGGERFSILKAGLIIGTLVGAGMFVVLTGSSIFVDGLDNLTTRLKGLLDLSVAVGVTGGVLWIIEPFRDKMAECIRRR